MALLTAAIAIGTTLASIGAAEAQRRLGETYQKKLTKAQEKENFRAQMLSMATNRHVQPTRVTKNPGAGLQFATAAGQYIPLLSTAATAARGVDWKNLFKGGRGGGGGGSFGIKHTQPVVSAAAGVRAPGPSTSPYVPKFNVRPTGP